MINKNTDYDNICKELAQNKECEVFYGLGVIDVHSKEENISVTFFFLEDCSLYNVIMSDYVLLE